jgi:hypothetical protein
LFAGSAGIFAAARFSKFAVAALHNLFDFIMFHLFHLLAAVAHSLFKVSIRSIRYADYTKELKNQIGNRNLFWKWKTASGQVE